MLLLLRATSDARFMKSDSCSSTEHAKHDRTEGVNATHAQIWLLIFRQHEQRQNMQERPLT